MELDMKLIKSAKDQPMILLSGHKYCLQVKNNSGTVNFRCCDREMCSASITTNAAMTIVLRKSDHTCLPNFEQNSIEWAMYCCKQKVAESVEPVQHIFEEALQDLPDMHHSILLPSFSSKKDALYDHRKRALGTDALKFNSSKDVKVPKIVSDNFLICEDVVGDSKILVFGSDLTKKYLKKTYRFLGDGTFKVVPKPFHQL